MDIPGNQLHVTFASLNFRPFHMLGPVCLECTFISFAKPDSCLLHCYTCNLYNTVHHLYFSNYFLQKQHRFFVSCKLVLKTPPCLILDKPHLSLSNAGALGLGDPKPILIRPTDAKAWLGLWGWVPILHTSIALTCRLYVNAFMPHAVTLRGLFCAMQSGQLCGNLEWNEAQASPSRRKTGK